MGKEKSYSPTYVPSSLDAADRKRQIANLKEARDAYHDRTYIDRPKLASFHGHTSSHILKAEQLYKKHFLELIQSVPGCTHKLQREILSKGRGAYYSSGSRPNQTSSSWALARFASAITGGKAARVDRKIIEKYCKASSKPVKILRSKYGKHSDNKR